MSAASTKRYLRRMCSLATLGLLAGTISALPDGADAQAHAPIVQTASTAIGMSELEHAFWVCDYTATMHGLDATPVALCSAVTDELKNVKFGGDFLALLEWWRQNKLEVHTRLEAAR